MTTDRCCLGRARLRASLSILAVGLLLVLIPGGAASAQSAELEDLTVRSRSGDPISGGGSATEFTLDLPDGAECPGDSANDDYRVGSYMLPATVDPFDVEWSGEGPVPYGLSDHEAFRQPLYDDLTSGFSSKMLAENEGPGAPGQILDLPAFTFDVFEPGMVPAGRYRIGIVCNYFAEVTTAWNAEIEVVTDAQDTPGQFSWTVVEGAASAETRSNLGLVGVALGGFAVAAVGAFLILRNRNSRPSTNRPQNTREIR